MTWHSDAINPTLATALLIAAGAVALVTLTDAIRRNQKATKLADLKGPAVWYLSAIAVAVGVPLFLISTAKLFETLLTENPGDVRWISLLFLSIVGAPFVIWRSFVAQAQADTAAQGMITDRINKAVEGLGAEKTVKRPVRSSDGKLTYEEATEPNLEVRVGAVLALERIAKDSPDDHIQIMEILCAYIRENACIVNIGSEEEPNWRQRVDTQTAISVLGRRSRDAIAREEARAAGYFLDFRDANLQCADLANGKFANAVFSEATLNGSYAERADFCGAELFETDFSEANLEYADLSNANLGQAILQNAHLPNASLSNAILEEADLRGANLVDADLSSSNLSRANLTNTNLRRAILQGAYLGRASLFQASLRGANLRNAYLWRSDLRNVSLKKSDLQDAHLVEANLQSAKLGSANLEGADLSHANLRKAVLRSTQLENAELSSCDFRLAAISSVDFTKCSQFDEYGLDAAFGVKAGLGIVKLPSGNAPDHWHEAEETENHPGDAAAVFYKAYKMWAAANPLPKS